MTTREPVTGWAPDHVARAVTAFRSIPPAVFAAVAVVTGPVDAAWAQAGTAGAGVQDRVGPNAPAPVTPPFAAPPATGSLIPPKAAPPSVLPDVPARDLLLSDVHVASTKTPRRAGRAKSGRVAALTAGGVKIEVKAGGRLDATWVRRQFELNGLIGHPTTAARVVGLVLAVNQVFLANGYINSGVLIDQQGWPDQSGVLALRLIDGRVSGPSRRAKGVTVTWANGKSKGLSRQYIRDRLPAAKASPLDGSALEHDFRLLAEDAAVRVVNAQLNPGARPGEASLSVSVDPQPRFDVYASYANSRSPSIGGERAAVGGSARNAVLSGDVAAVEVGETAGATDAMLSYSAPLTTLTALNLRVSYDDAGVVTSVLRTLDIRSRDAAQEIGLSHIVIAEPLTPIGETGHWSPAQSLTVGAAFAQRESTSSLLGQPFSFSPGSVAGQSDYTVARLTTNWVLRGETQVLAVAATANFGIHGSGSDVPGVQRPDENFRTQLLQVNYARRFLDGGLEFHARFAGQATSGLLYTGEQFAIGGASTVRGFRENLLLADSGAVGSVELSCVVHPGVIPCTKAPEGWDTVRLVPFLDGGFVHSQAGVQPDPASIESVGLSLLWTPISAVSTRLTYGQPFRYAPPLGKSDIQDRGFSFEVTLHPLGLIRPWR